jgi:hypothetical protein
MGVTLGARVNFDFSCNRRLCQGVNKVEQDEESGNRGFVQRSRTVRGLRCLLLIVTAVFLVAAQDKKLTIVEIMKKTHEQGGEELMKKVANGKASKEEKQLLVDLYKMMAEHKPSKGSEESWKEKTKLLIEAAEEALKGNSGAGQKLKRAANCQACHDVHHP